LLAATLLLLFVAVGGGGVAFQGSQAVRAGEMHSYARLLNLWQARTLVYDASANETLTLVARDASAQFDQSFRLETSQLVDRPLTDQLVQAAAQGQVQFNGLLADELRGDAPAAEKDSALNILRAYQRFIQADAAVRAAGAPVTGRTAAAAAVAAAAAQDQASSAFADLDWHLGVAIS